MNSGATAALITGIFAVFAAVVAGIYRLRSVRAQRSSEKPLSPAASIIITTPITITTSPSDDIQSPLSSTTINSSQFEVKNFPPDTSPPTATAPTNLKPSTSPSDAQATQILPLVSPDRSYEGLNTPDLEVQFITDVQFTLKAGDQFTFDDTGGI